MSTVIPRRRSDFLGTQIGSYANVVNKPFIAQRLGVPVDYKSSKKLHFDFVHTIGRFAFYTDRGNFWGPLLSGSSPPELEVSHERILSTAPVLFRTDFTILNVLCVDLKHRLLVRPVDFQIVDLTEADKIVTFQFQFEQYTHAPASWKKR